MNKYNKYNVEPILQPQTDESIFYYENKIPDDQEEVYFNASKDPFLGEITLPQKPVRNETVDLKRYNK